jgi:hypothetical protein
MPMLSDGPLTSFEQSVYIIKRLLLRELVGYI